MANKIKKGDTVVVLSGKDKGKTGEVTRVLGDKVVVQNVRIVKRHTRANPQINQPGGIVEREAPIHISNVMPWCEAAGKPSRIVMKRLEDGRRIRVWKLTGETLD